MEQRVLVGDEKLAPHQIVDPRDPGQVAEGISREFFHVFLVVAGHERNGDTMRQLRQETDHLVMLLRGQRGDAGEPEQSADLHARLD